MKVKITYFLVDQASLSDANPYGGENEARQKLPRRMLRKRAAVAAGQAQKCRDRLHTLAQHKTNASRSQSIECTLSPDDALKPGARFRADDGLERATGDGEVFRPSTADIGVILFL